MTVGMFVWRFPRVRCLPAGALMLLTLACFPSGADAQPPLPITGFVVDARGAIPFLPNNNSIAGPRETTAEQMPGLGLGIDVGAHVYPFRWKVITFGFGGSYHMSQASKTPPTLEGATSPSGPTVNSRFQALAPQLSLNFGHRMGWSYLSGGIGRATFRSWRADLPEDEGESTRTLNYGAGARWFVNDHLAFSVDLRFYAMNPVEPSATAIGHARMTFAVGAVGVSFR